MDRKSNVWAIREINRRQGQDQHMEVTQEK